MESRVRQRRDGHVQFAGQGVQNGFQFTQHVLVKISRRSVHGRHGIFHQQDSIFLGLTDPPIQLVVALAQRLKKLVGLNYGGSSRHRTPLINLSIFDPRVFGCLDPPHRAVGTEKN